MSEINLDFSGQVAIVTGGSRGIGKSICNDLAEAGATVILADINAEEGEKTASELGENVSFLQLDVTDENAVDAAIAKIIKEHKKIDILVNNAGKSRRIKLVNTETEEWDEIFDINIKGAFYTCRAVIPQMIRLGGGKIVNIGAMVARQPVETFSAYCASKAALLAFTESIGKEYINDKININAVCPGTVKTGMWSEDNLNTKDLSICSSFDEIIQMFPSGKASSTEDVAHLVIYMCSHAAKHMAGQIFNVTV